MEESNMGRSDNLRRNAEKRLSAMNSADDIPAEDARRLIHELRVHQIELEMQNEELRRAQVQLEESRTQYADLYDFAPVAYLTFDEHGLILKANLTAAKQLGTERTRLLKSVFHSYVLEQDKDKSRLHLARVFQTRERQTCEVWLKPRSSGQFYAQLESIFIEDSEGTGRCRTSIIDISQCKIAEEQLQRAHDELEKRVVESTAELAKSNEELQQEVFERRRAEIHLKSILEKLERSSQELQDFAYSASHDMQEPLRKIRTFGNMIRQESLDDKSRDCLQRMMNAAARMSDMVRGLLNYSRVNTRGTPFIPVDLTGVAREAADSLKQLSSKAGATFEISELPTIDVDPEQMLLLFKNLIENALKFRTKKPFIKIYAKSVAHPDRSWPGEGEHYYDIFVEDNGIGFDERHLDRIFTLFQRLHGRSSYEGTGMGLPVCRRIVERHHGSITAKSTPGTGTTFIITLPSTRRPDWT